MSAARHVPVVISVAISFLTPQTVAADSKSAVLATFRAERNEVFLGEVFPMVLEVRALGTRLGKNLNLSSMPDPKVLRLSDFRELPTQRRTVGRRVEERRRFTCLARPATAGRVQVAPVLRVGILSRRKRFLGASWLETSRDLRVTPFVLTVRRLPTDGKPDDFSGAIGTFEFDVALSPTNLVAGDLVTATLTVRGKGSVEDMVPPRFSPGRSFKTYDPELVSGSEEGLRSYTQIIVPQSSNALHVAPVSLSYFDPVAKAYSRISRGPFSLSFRDPERITFEHFRPEDDPEGPNATVVASSREQVPTMASRLARAVASPSHEIVALAGYCTVALVAALWLGMTRKRGALWSLAAVLLATLLFVPYRTGVRTVLLRKPQHAVVRDVAARLAPSHSALETFHLPKGAGVRIIDVYGTWAKIEQGSHRGWAPQDAVE